ncbi:putative indole-3-glycerol-phosphate synthase [Rosellinia necatrix]|uniref:Putative indole-3-glycerol-phosphate synthase n=1 Tax=Rosellinia necatrix TaxID=77044 RepID=A0A1S8A5U2_ROSNE|nr:putative indole-3-glycerol-phosphate synthase [Rosellinia necatrix]
MGRRLLYPALQTAQENEPLGENPVFTHSQQASYYDMQTTVHVTMHCIISYPMGDGWTMDGRWAVGSGQWAVGSGQWAVGSGQWAVGSGQWAMDDGRWMMGEGHRADGFGEAVAWAQARE